MKSIKNSSNVRAACEAAGISRQMAYLHRSTSLRFAALWDEALEDAADILEARAWVRSEVSDTILMFMLKAHRPGKYRETININLLNQEAAKIAAQVGLTADELLARAEAFLTNHSRVED